MFLYQGNKIHDVVRIRDVNYSLPWIEQVSLEQLTALGISQVSDPIYPDPNIYTWTENADGSLNIVALTADQLAAKKAANIDILWQAAHDYEYAQISGVAVGLLTVGVLQSLPKSLAIKDWSKSIWTLYYSRKASVTDMLDPTFLDFSSCGNIPYTIPELMVEINL